MPMMGQITLFGGSREPAGWAFCDGRFLPIQTYPNFYSVLGNTYGGDVRNFALPNLPPVVDANTKVEIRYIICIQGDYPYAAL